MSFAERCPIVRDGRGGSTPETNRSLRRWNERPSDICTSPSGPNPPCYPGHLASDREDRSLMRARVGDDGDER